MSSSSSILNSLYGGGISEPPRGGLFMRLRNCASGRLRRMRADRFRRDYPDVIADLIVEMSAAVIVEGRRDRGDRYITQAQYGMGWSGHAV